MLELIQRHRVTQVFAVPSILLLLTQFEERDRFDLSSLRGGIMAGSPCPIEVMKRVHTRMHMREVTIAYGMTETSPVSFQSATDDPLDKRVSTVGRVQPHLEVKIADEHGNPVAPGVTGELCTRGYSVMLGYWDDEEKTAEAVDADPGTPGVQVVEGRPVRIEQWLAGGDAIEEVAIDQRGIVGAAHQPRLHVRDRARPLDHDLLPAREIGQAERRHDGAPRDSPTPPGRRQPNADPEPMCNDVHRVRAFRWVSATRQSRGAAATRCRSPKPNSGSSPAPRSSATAASR